MPPTPRSSGCSTHPWRRAASALPQPTASRSSPRVAAARGGLTALGWVGLSRLLDRGWHCLRTRTASSVLASVATRMTPAGRARSSRSQGRPPLGRAGLPTRRHHRSARRGAAQCRPARSVSRSQRSTQQHGGPSEAGASTSWHCPLPCSSGGYPVGVSSATVSATVDGLQPHVRAPHSRSVSRR